MNWGIVSRYFAYAVGLIMILAYIFYGKNYSLFFFPIFTISLVFFHLKNSKKINIRLLLFIIFYKCTEFGFVYDFETYFTVIVLCSFVSQILLITLLKPLLNFKVKKIETHYWVEVLIGFLGITTILVFILYNVLPQLPNFILYVPSLFTFLFLLVLCFVIPLFEKHPYHVYLWGVGAGYLGEWLMAFIYQYIQAEPIYMTVAIIFGTLYKIVLLHYFMLIDNKEVRVDEDYI